MAKIIIIEDEVSIRNVLKNILTEENKDYKIDEAENGEEGINLLFAKKYDLALCDIKMPGKDGFDVIPELNSEYPDIPIIATSGHMDEFFGKDILKLGAKLFLSKPFKFEELSEKIKDVLLSK